MSACLITDVKQQWATSACVPTDGSLTIDYFLHFNVLLNTIPKMKNMMIQLIQLFRNIWHLVPSS